jgi:hypothetical protein
VATPTLVQHVDINQFDGYTTLVIRLKSKTLLNNCVIVTLYNASAQTISTVTDDAAGGSNTYTSAGTFSDGSQRVTIFVAPGVKAGAREITVTPSAATTFVSAKVSEFYNVATSSPVDTNGTSAGASANSATITAGAFPGALGNSGDLIYQVGFNETAGSNFQSIYTAGSQANITWALAPGSTNSFDSSYAQYGTYTATAAFTPTLTEGNSNTYISLAIALKSASAGTAPAAGIRVVAVQNMGFGAITPLVTQFVTTGNLQVLTSTSGDGIASITSSNGNKWQLRVSQKEPSHQFFAEIWDSVSASPGSQTLTITMNAGATGNNSIMIYDVIGAAVNPFDTSGKNNGNQGSDTGTLPITGGTLPITPTTSNGLVFFVTSIAIGTATTLTGSNQLSDCAQQTPLVEPSALDQNNGYGTYLNPNTSSVPFTWNIVGTGGTGVNDWAASSAAYKAPSGTTITQTGTPIKSSLTWTAPVGVTAVKVEAWGGGAAGGGVSSTTGSGGAGGGGAYEEKNTIGVTAGTGYTVTVAATKAGTSGANGGNGNTTTFTGDASVSVTANGGTGGQSKNNGSAGGAGGTTGSGDNHHAGGLGGNGGSGSTVGSGGGGAGASDTAVGNAGGNGSAGVAGSAGATTTGSDANHNGGAGAVGKTASGNGGNGVAPGGGGSGAIRTTSGTATGGTGAAGQVILTYTANDPATGSDPPFAPWLSQPMTYYKTEFVSL